MDLNGVFNFNYVCCLLVDELKLNGGGFVNA